MNQEWFPVIVTGLTALYAVWVLFRVVWDKHRYQKEECQRRELTHNRYKRNRT